MRGAPPPHYPPTWQAGIRLHRRIDAFVDRHEAFRTSLKRLPAAQRRWGRVALDVYYDHLLSRHWSDYGTVPLEQFAAGVYTTLAQHHPALPPRLQRFAAFMTEQNLLTGYRQPAVIEDVLRRMAARAHRPNTLAQSFTHLRAADAGIADDLGRLFPDVLAFARREVATRPSRVQVPDRFGAGRASAAS
ncbi:MAG: ACP phosphodiesterase [Immundisolibacter sp.]